MRKTDTMARGQQFVGRTCKTAILFASATMLALSGSACDLQLEPLPDTEASSIVLPAGVQQLCTPLFRDVDVVSIIVELNATQNAGGTKTAAISTATNTCSEGAQALLDIAEEEGSTFEFSALDAIVWEADCINCYVFIIDDMFDD